MVQVCELGDTGQRKSMSLAGLVVAVWASASLRECLGRKSFHLLVYRDTPLRGRRGTVQVHAHSPCFGGLVPGIGASRRLSEATPPFSESMWHARSLLAGFLTVFGVMGGVASPSTHSYLPGPHRSLAGYSPDTPRSTSDYRSEVLRRVSGEAPVRPADGLAQVRRNRGPEARLFSGARLGSDGSPTRGKRSNGQSRGTV